MEDSRVEDILASGQRDYKFTNWSTTFSCSPELYFEPKTTEEIREILQVASMLRKRVRVIGGCYSPSDIACTSEFMVCLKNYSAVLEINHDKKQVTVQAGLLVNDLNQLLDRHGLALPNLSSVSGMSCAGTLGTCTHGTGINYGLVANFVVSLELMTAKGEILHCSRSSNKDIFLAALCHLGSVGIILSVTWQCEPAFKLHQQCEAMTLEKVLDSLETWKSSDEYFKFHWYPHTGQAKVYHVNRTSEPVTDSSSWFWDKAIGYWSLEFLYWLSSFVPQLVPYVNWGFFKLLHSQPSSRVDQSFKVFNFDCLFKQYVTEWAIPQDKTAFVLRKLQSWIKESGYHVHFPVEVRFVKKDDIFMSPCYEQDVCFINIIAFRPYNKFIPHEPYWKYYEELCMSVGGKPHWAKAHDLTATDIAKMFPKFQEFREICQKLDPLSLFRNEYVDKVIFGSASVSNGGINIGGKEQSDQQSGSHTMDPGQ